MTSRCTFDELLSCRSFNHIVGPFVSANYKKTQYAMAALLSECVMVRDGLFYFSCRLLLRSAVNDALVHVVTSIYSKITAVAFYMFLCVFNATFSVYVVLCVRF